VPAASVLTDSYKAGHFTQYPETDKMCAYGEFRCGYDGDAADTRLVSYGVRYVVQNFVQRQWTLRDVEQAEAFYSQHLAPMNTAYPYPKDLFRKVVTEHGGYLPVTLQALPEGTCVNAHVPVYQITAEGEFAYLATFLETLLTMVWYPSTVATLSRRAKDVIEAAFRKSVSDDVFFLLPSRLHDFGFRGCCTAEQSVVGGCAHLLNFEGSDTMSACYYAQFVLNGGKPVASSIPATEHSVMTSWKNEQLAIENMIEKYGSGLFACVMDSYDYMRALTEILPAVAEKKVEKGGYMVLRPDSGDPVDCVLKALEAADKVFGSDVNDKGFKVIKGCGVIQGDGVNIAKITNILDAALAAGYSAQNIAFGMGGGLLQKLNRDTMSFATKLNYIRYADGEERAIMKAPKTDTGKYSLPGILSVFRVDGVPTVFPAGQGPAGAEDLLQVVYDKGPVAGMEWDDFSAVQDRVNAEWGALPKAADPLSAELKELITALNPHLKV